MHRRSFPGISGRAVRAQCVTAALWAGLLLPGATAAADTLVAGTTPERRPEGAPRVATAVRPPNWHASATTGIEKPHPPSLRFLNDQGSWFTPFTMRGMTGPYDIRGLHASRSGAQPGEPQAGRNSKK